jgi:glycosyltransferase involved in cell wall biosynthesis
MKLLIISSLYSSLNNSIFKREWQPQGMPAFTKLIESLENRNIDFDVILLSRIPNNIVKKKQIIKIGNFSADFHVITFVNHLNFLKRSKWLEPLLELILDIIYISYCVRVSFKRNYDVFYCDRANVTIAAFFSFFLKKRVFLRLHGVISLYNQFNRRKTKFINLIRYISFHAPFTYIVCSKDGTPGESFLKRFRSRNAPYEILLNGVDVPSEDAYDRQNIRKQHGIQNGVLVILFVGRLEKSKGCDLFIQSIIKLNKKNDNFTALIIGEGPLYEELFALITSHNLSDKIIMKGSVKYKDIYKYYDASDIYVSLNHHGNLSNTVLEAIHSGKCIVTFGKCKITKRDEDTYELLKDNAILIDRNNVLDELPDALNVLIENPQQVAELRKKTLALSKTLLKTWKQRIDYEIDLLEKITARNNLPSQK